MPKESVITVCCACPKQHIMGITGDPSQELVDLVETTHLESRHTTPELNARLDEEGCILSHGLCDVAYKATKERMDKEMADSGIRPSSIRRMLMLRSAMRNEVDQNQEGAAKFHREVQNLIEQGGDRAQLIQVLTRIRDSYPEGDHHRDIAQAEISWVSGLPQDAFDPTPASVN